MTHNWQAYDWEDEDECASSEDEEHSNRGHFRSGRWHGTIGAETMSVRLKFKDGGKIKGKGKNDHNANLNFHIAGKFDRATGQFEWAKQFDGDKHVVIYHGALKDKHLTGQLYQAAAGPGSQHSPFNLSKKKKGSA